jgi:outer membrane immunogenic protein
MADFQIQAAIIQAPSSLIKKGPTMIRKCFRRSCALFILFSLPAGIALADSYMGIKAGILQMDFDDFDAPVNLGLVFGTQRTGWGAEVEITAPTSKGEAGDTSIDLSMVGGFVVYRSGGQIYYKTRIGIVNQDAQFRRDIASNDSNEADTGLAMGFGFGFPIGKHLALETELTLIESDIADHIVDNDDLASLTVGIHY